MQTTKYKTKANLPECKNNTKQKNMHTIIDKIELGSGIPQVICQDQLTIIVNCYWFIHQLLHQDMRHVGSLESMKDA